MLEEWIWVPGAVIQNTLAVSPLSITMLGKVSSNPLVSDVRLDNKIVVHVLWSIKKIYITVVLIFIFYLIHIN